MREIIERFVADFQTRELPAFTPRTVKWPVVPGKANAVVGMRRSGKTFFLLQRIAELGSEGVPRRLILYVNFEDERLLPLATRDLQEFPDALYRLYPENRDALCYLFLDAIHVVPGWEHFVRRLVEEGRVQVAVTGSSARLLSREVASSLRGRSLTTEILPFSFEEALRNRGIQPPERFPVPERLRSILEKQFREYIHTGGFPEVQAMSAELRTRVLQEYVQVAVFRDVVERYAIAHVAALHQLVRHIVSAPARLLSVHKVYQALKSQGFRLAKDAVYDDVRFLEDAFLLFTVERESSSTRVRMVNPRKCYVADPGIAGAFSQRASQGIGYLLENIVYLELRRRGCDLTYMVTHDGHEVDFVARRAGKPDELIQVCADLRDGATRERELQALREGLQEIGSARCTIVTLGDEETIALGRRRVRAVPAWRWLLEDRATTVIATAHS
ncbi:MAG: ATP-binding protein [Acidobacteriota bacterium]